MQSWNRFTHEMREMVLLQSSDHQGCWCPREIVCVEPQGSTEVRRCPGVLVDPDVWAVESKVCDSTVCVVVVDPSRACG